MRSTGLVQLFVTNFDIRTAIGKFVQVRHRKMRVAPDLDEEAGMNRIGGQFRSSPISQAADRALGFGYLENRESAHHGLVKCFGIRFGINEVAPKFRGNLVVRYSLQSNKTINGVPLRSVNCVFSWIYR